MEKVKKAIDRKVSCELKDVSVESTGNTRLPTWIPTYECAWKVFLEKWKWEGKFHTQRGWHHPKGSRDQMKGERKPSTAAPFFLFPDHGSSVTGLPALTTAMPFSHGEPCPFKLWAQKNPSSLKRTFAWNFVTETRNITNTKLKAQTQHPIIFSILCALIHWLLMIFNGNNTRFCYRSVNPEEKYMCVYSFDFIFTRGKCSLIKTVLCRKNHHQIVSMTSDPQRTAQISKNPHFCFSFGPGGLSGEQRSHGQD